MLHLPGLVKHSSLTFSHMLSLASLPPPCSAQQNIRKHTLSKALSTPLSGEKGVGQNRSWGNLVAQHPVDFSSPESTILVLKWVSQRHLLLHVIPLVLWQMMKKLLLYIQCESEVL